jgi:hypothetical protein
MGLPSPVFALKGKKVDKGVTNICNTTSRTGGDGSGRPRGTWFPSRRSARTTAEDVKLFPAGALKKLLRSASTIRLPSSRWSLTYGPNGADRGAPWLESEAS